MLGTALRFAFAGLTLGASLVSVPSSAQEFLPPSISPEYDAALEEQLNELQEIAQRSPAELDARCTELQQAVDSGTLDGPTYQASLLCLVAKLILRLNANRSPDELPFMGASSEQWQSQFEEAYQAVLPELQRIVDRWIENIPDDPRAHLMRANLKTTPAETEHALRQAAERFPDDADISAQLASTLMQQGDSQNAQELLEHFVANHPEDARGLQVLVGVLVGQDKNALARQRVEAWLVRRPDDPVALSVLLWLRGRELTTEEIQRVLRTALDPRIEQGHAVELCGALENQRFSEEAMTCFRGQLERAQSSGDQRRVNQATRGLARSLAGLKRWTEAADALAAITDTEQAQDARLHLAWEAAMLQEDCAAATQLLTGIDEGWLADPERRSIVANIRMECGDAETSAASSAAFLATASSDELRYELYTVKIDLAEAEKILLGRTERGELTPGQAYEALAELSSRGSTTDAIPYLNAWAEFDPLNPEPASRLAEALRSTGALDLAIEAQREAARRAPRDATYVKKLVDLLLESHQLDEAQAIAEGVLQENERFGEQTASGHRMLASVALARGDQEAALRHFETYYAEAKVLSVDARDEYLRLLRDRVQLEAIAQFLDRQYEQQGQGDWHWGVGRDEYLASSYESLDMPDAALAIVERQLAVVPQDSRLHAQKGQLLKRLGRFDEGVASLRLALQLDPSDDVSLQNLAEIHLEQEQFQEAVELLKPVVERRRRLDSSLALLLARAYQEGGKPGQAVPLLERVLDQEAENDDAAFALGEALDATGQREKALVAYRRFLELTASYEGQTSATCTCHCEVLDERTIAKRRLDELAEEQKSGEQPSPEPALPQPPGR